MGRAGIFDSEVEAINLLSFVILGAIIYLTVGSQSLRRMPPACWSLLVASAIMYLISLFAVLKLSSLVLYFPSRYTRASLFLIALLFVGLNWRGFLARARFHSIKNTQSWLILAVLGISILGIIMLLIPAARVILPFVLLIAMPLNAVLVILTVSSLYWRIRERDRDIVMWHKGSTWSAKSLVGLLSGAAVIFLAIVYIRTLGVGNSAATINPTSEERALYGFVGSLPEDALLMGDPEVMTGIPLFAKRSVLFRSLQPNLSAPILPFFDAYYAESPQGVLDFCRQYSIDYFVINQGQFAPDYLAAGQFFYDPYNEIIAQTVATRTHFVLPQIADEHKLFQSGDLFVIPCEAHVFD